MANQGDILTDLGIDADQGDGHTGNGADTGPAAGIITQYIKDLSVENPNAPKSFQWQEQPHIDLQFNIAANAVENEIHEVELKINASATCDSGQIYLVELMYAGLVGLRNVPEDQAHMFLYAEAPRLLFPFARRVIADATRDLGFQPLVVEPIDFNGLYMQRLAEKQQEEAAGADRPAGEPN